MNKSDILLPRLTNYVFVGVTFRLSNIKHGQLLGGHLLIPVIALSVTKVWLAGNALHFNN
jgi:hypothetical protein